MAKTYNSVFGEGPNNKINTYLEKTVSSETANTQNQESVTEVLKKYHKMSPKDKAEFMDENKKENEKS